MDARLESCERDTMCGMPTTMDCAFAVPTPCLYSYRQARLPEHRRPVRAQARRRRVAPSCILQLPWESSEQRDRGLLTTSFEACTVVGYSPVEDCLLCDVDVDVTCTSEQYRRVGQWVWLKPWGDEDGNLAACPLYSPPDGRSVIKLALQQDGAVAQAVVAEEMLEVSEVMGQGFDSSVVKSLDDVTAICGIAVGPSTLPLLLALREIDTSDKHSHVVFGRHGDGSAYEALAREWVDEDPSTRTLSAVESVERAEHELQAFLNGRDAQACAVLLACPSDRLERVATASGCKLYVNS